ncbi:hypothetical protein ACFW4K_07330 [Nocardiopsis alba]|uniref:hypothetical protein n=1 Tax=Nocardiopsis alba TaxID=53437 RepID=UPI0036723EED
MTEKDRKESLIKRAAEKLFVGTGPKAPFLIRHDWAVPVIVFGACGAFAILVMISIIQSWAQVLMWIVIGIGVVSVLPAIPGFVEMYRATRGPLPALDRTPRTTWPLCVGQRSCCCPGWDRTRYPTLSDGCPMRPSPVRST